VYFLQWTDITRFLRERVSKHKKPLPGDALWTESGLKKCKIIIFAIVSSWQNNRESELDFMFEAIISALKIADSQSMTKIAIGGVPERYAAPLACNTLCEAVDDFLRNCQQELEISFVDTNEGVLRCMDENMQKRFSTHGSQESSGASQGKG